MTKMNISKSTLKLSKVKRLPNRIEPIRIKYEFVTANRTRTFLKKIESVRSNQTSKLTE